MLKHLLWIGLLAFGGYQWWVTRPVTHGPGIIAPEAPLQEPVTAAPFDWSGYRITPLASFEIEARVLGTESYRLDRGAKLVPIDLALGWGPMSDERVLEHVAIRQGNRFYLWSVNQFPIPEGEIIAHSANMHLIPSSEAIKRQIKALRVGQVVSVRGYLVRVDAPDRWIWQSSLSRTDTGDGACELVWVESFAAR